MIEFDEIDLPAFFETEAEPDPDESTILRYSVVTKTGMDLVFTIDSPLRCTHPSMSRDGVVLVDAGTEGVVEVRVAGKGDLDRSVTSVRGDEEDVSAETRNSCQQGFATDDSAPAVLLRRRRCARSTRRER